VRTHDAQFERSRSTCHLINDRTDRQLRQTLKRAICGKKTNISDREQEASQTAGRPGRSDVHHLFTVESWSDQAGQKADSDGEEPRWKMIGCAVRWVSMISHATDQKSRRAEPLSSRWLDFIEIRGEWSIGVGDTDRHTDTHIWTTRQREALLERHALSWHRPSSADTVNHLQQPMREQLLTVNGFNSPPATQPLLLRLRPIRLSTANIYNE